jgi:hypothetical protein
MLLRLFGGVFLWLVAASAAAQDLQQVTTLGAGDLLTLEEVELAPTESAADDLRIRLFRFVDLSAPYCEGELCARRRFYVVLYRLDEVPNYAVFVSPLAVNWGDFSIIDVRSTGSDVDLRISVSRDPGRGAWQRVEVRARSTIP